MEANEIERKVRQIIAGKLDIAYEKVTSQCSFTDELGADSLDQVEIVMEIEDEFDIHIDDSDVDKITTVKAAIDYVQRRI